MGSSCRREAGVGRVGTDRALAALLSSLDSLCVCSAGVSEPAGRGS